MYDHHHSLDMGHPYSEIGNLISLKCQQGCWDRTRGSVHGAVGMGMGVGKGGHTSVKVLYSTSLESIIEKCGLVQRRINLIVLWSWSWS